MNIIADKIRCHSAVYSAAGDIMTFAVIIALHSWTVFLNSINEFLVYLLFAFSKRPSMVKFDAEKYIPTHLDLCKPTGLAENKLQPTFPYQFPLCYLTPVTQSIALNSGHWNYGNSYRIFKNRSQILDGGL